VCVASRRVNAPAAGDAHTTDGLSWVGYGFAMQGAERVGKLNVVRF